MTPSLVTIPNVPLISVGIEYPAASGPITFTAEDVADIVASQDDPAIVAPRLKLSQDVIHGTAIANTPAFGVADNLRLGDNGQTVYCDFVGVPVWLAEIMPTAFPNRSVEGWQNWETVTGKKYGFVVTHVELLGVTWPGCSVLEDLPLYYGPEMPADVEVAASLATVGSDATLEDKPATTEQVNAARAREVAAAVNVDDVRRAYYDTLNSDQGWWWIRAVYIDPNELIVDDDESTLYRVPFSISGDEFTFSDEVEVKIEYVDVPKKQAASVAVAAMSAMHGADHTKAVYASKAESRPDKEDDVSDDKKLRESLGLAETATDDEVKAAFAEKYGEHAPGSEEPDPAGGEGQEGVKDEEPPDGEEPDGEEPDGEEEPEAIAASAKVVSIDKKRLEHLERDAAAGVTARRSQVEAQADSLVKAAVEDGRIAPASKADWRAAVLPKGKTELVTAEVETLESLSAGRIPVDERGAAEGLDGADSATHTAIMASFGVAGKD